MPFSRLHVRLLPCLLLFVSAGPMTCPAQIGIGVGTSKKIRNVVDFAGPSIVERIQAALLDCGPNPCELYIPAGTYDTSAISSWKGRNATGLRVGIQIPSNVDIRGAGEGRTIIRVTRSANDPIGTLLANANESNRNIRVHDMSIVWTDSSSKYDWVSILICQGCDHLELDHLSLEGNPNKMVNLLDSTESSVHDNTFLLRSTSYGHGDNALSVNRFNPAISVDRDAGVVRDNHFIQAGEYRSFSMLIVSQSGLYVHSNVFEAHLRLRETPLASNLARIIGAACRRT